MGISPQLYRTRIGCFNPNPKSKKNKMKNSMSSNNKMGQSWTCVGLFSALILIVCTNFVILNQISTKNSEPKSNILETVDWLQEHLWNALKILDQTHFLV